MESARGSVHIPCIRLGRRRDSRHSGRCPWRAWPRPAGARLAAMRPPAAVLKGESVIDTSSRLRSCLLDLAALSSRLHRRLADSSALIERHFARTPIAGLARKHPLWDRVGEGWPVLAVALWECTRLCHRPRCARFGAPCQHPRRTARDRKRAGMSRSPGGVPRRTLRYCAVRCATEQRSQQSTAMIASGSSILHGP